LPAIFGVVAAGFLLLAASPVRGQAESAGNAGLPSADLVKVRLVQHLIRLASVESRALGYPGHEKAAEYITSEFTRLGLVDLQFDEFERAVPVDEGATLTLSDGKRFKLACFWPNLVRTPKTPPEGISGRLFYAADGAPTRLSGVDLSDKIVILDLASEDRYILIRSLGARAIIFVEPDRADRGEFLQKVLDAPVNIPRYWLSQRQWQRLKECLAGNPQARIVARMEWRRVKARNIIARLPGADESLADEPIVLMSWYDASSVVPAVAPGADQASGVAALLWLAEYFSEHRPARPVWFVALDSHALAQGGIDRFVVRHCFAGRTYYDWAGKFISVSPPERGTPIRPKILIDLNLSSGTRVIGPFYDGQGITTTFHRDAVLKLGDVILEAVDPAWLEQTDVKVVSGIRPLGGVTWQSFLPVKVMLDSTVALKAKQHAFAIATALDSRSAWDTPLDTLERVNIDNLVAQVRVITAALGRVLSDPDVVRRNTSERDFAVYRWQVWPFICKANKSKLSDRPVTTEPMPDALVIMRVENRQAWWAGGYSTEIGLSRADGYYIDPLWNHIRLFIYGYKTDPRDGSIVYAADRGEQGEGRQPLDVKRANGVLVLFRCVTMDLYDLADPIRFKDLNTYTVLLPTGGAPQKFGYCWPPRNDPRLCLTVHVRRGERIRFAAGRGMFGFQYLLLNATPENPEGGGVLIDREMPVFFSNLRALDDLMTLNKARFKRLTDKGIKDELVAELLQKAEAAQQRAHQAAEQKDWDSFFQAVYEGLGYATAAYPLVKAMARDTVEGVVFYFALLIPFAFFLERLLLGLPDIRKQILAVAVIFLIVFVIMRFVHPAFEISDSPYVIFLAFIIMALAAIVLCIVVSKFGEQMKELRTAGGEIHRVDVGRISATMAAVMLGISNLRKRKVRTTLTTTTVILLTFAVLSFTVVSSRTRYYRVPRPYEGSYDGILFRDRNWMPIKASMQDYIAYAFKGTGAVVVPRAWLFSERDNNLSIPIKGPTGKWFDIPAAVGVYPDEAKVSGLDRLLTAGRWISDAFSPQCVLPSSVAAALDVDLSDPARSTIEAFGVRWRVVGIIDSERLGKFADLDGEPISPIAARTGPQARQMTATAANELRLEAEAKRSVQVPTSVHVDPRSTPFFSYEVLTGCGARLMSIAVGGVKPSSVKERLDGLLARSNLLAFVSEDGAVRAFSATGQTSVGWASGLIVPIIIASLIILNTMLGSVYERQREISIYSSVGLAPSHVAALFIAESSVFAVVGAFSGYLLGQVVVKILGSLGWLGGINVNYSSTAAVLTSVIVMAVVLLSAVYPSKVAARIAVPDVTRRWTFPPPQGDVWKFEFPFTVADWQVLGLFAFLADFFEACAEESVGVFYTRNTRFTREGSGRMARHKIELDVWLAPYDLGISQHVTLLAEPTEDPHIHRVEMTIVRLSGENAAWQQRNRAFLAELRKQFLIYRTIPEGLKARWEQRALEQFGDLQAAAGVAK